LIVESRAKHRLTPQADNQANLTKEFSLLRSPVHLPNCSQPTAVQFAQFFAFYIAVPSNGKQLKDSLENQADCWE